MIITTKTFKFWKSLQEHTDIEKIAESSGISRVTISNALRTGRASGTTIIAIHSYFIDKNKLLTPLATK